MSSPNRFAGKTVWIFDFDGTLVDSMGHCAVLASTIMHQHFAIPIDEAREQYRQTSGLPFVAQLEHLYPGDARNTQAVEQYEQNKAQYYLDQPLFPEARATLETLRRRGHFVAISSNNQHELVDGYVSIHRLAADLVCGWAPNFAKGPAHFHSIMQSSGRKAPATIFVGDSLRDAATAQAHGITFVARTGTFTSAEFQAAYPSVPVIASLRELV